MSKRGAEVDTQRASDHRLHACLFRWSTGQTLLTLLEEGDVAVRDHARVGDKCRGLRVYRVEGGVSRAATRRSQKMLWRTRCH